MKKTITALVCVLIALCPAFAASAKSGEAPSVSASAYALYCPQNGSMILSKNKDEHKKPASTTKLMTTLITLERSASCNETVTFTEKMTAEGSSMYLEYGDSLKLTDLAAGMMMCSGNDAANAAAIAVSGSFEGFSRLMNSRAQRIGMRNTHFVTPSGLDDDDHYSCAEDMALLMAECLKNERMSALISQKSATVNFISPSNKHMTYTNHNRLLSMYPDCIGGKTGYTTAAGRCLVTAAKRDGLTLICVTLDDKNDWNDHISLYDYGFSALACRGDSDFSADIPVMGGESDTLRVGSEGGELIVPREKLGDVRRTVRLDSFLFAPVNRGDIVGVIEYSLDGKILRRENIISLDSVEYKRRSKGLLEKIKELFNG